MGAAASSAKAALGDGLASAIFACPLAPADADMPAMSHDTEGIPAVEKDDLEKYLALPVEANLDLDVLKWWKARDHSLP
eukprot:scaffold297697_cov36-Tisochrysis_lutea.AAC.1